MTVVMVGMYGVYKWWECTNGGSVHMVGVYEMAGGRCTNDGCNMVGVYEMAGIHMVGVYKMVGMYIWWGCTYGGSVRNGRGQVYK